VIALPSATAMVALVVAAATSPSTFDGSRPLLCRADRSHDCTPGAYDCKVLEPQPDQPALFRIDFAKKEIRSPFRTTVLTVTHTTDTSESLVLQGADLLLAWSALINKSTGALTVSIADRQGRMSSSRAARMPRTSLSSAMSHCHAASESRSRRRHT
jgi:hypothetical protein